MNTHNAGIFKDFIALCVYKHYKYIHMRVQLAGTSQGSQACEMSRTYMHDTYTYTYKSCRHTSETPY